MVDDLSMDKTGIKAVLDAEVRPSDPVPGDCGAVEQLDLLPLRKVIDENEAAETDTPAVRGRGRPAGSQNKSTKAWQEYLLSRYSSPLIALAETYSRPVDDLARDLGFTDDKPGGRRVKPEERLELFKIQLQCVKELAPYVHQKQPMAIDTGGAGLMQLIINNGVSQDQVDESGTMSYDFIDVESEQNQEVSDDEKQNSVGSDSVVSGQAIDLEDETKEGKPD